MERGAMEGVVVVRTARLHGRVHDIMARQYSAALRPSDGSWRFALSIIELTNQVGLSASRRNAVSRDDQDGMRR